MKFIEKLTQDTRNGKFDFAWRFSSPDKYTFKQEKHPLSEMNFNLSDSSDTIIFPNGMSLRSSKEAMSTLKDEVIKAMNRSIDSIISAFVNSTINENSDKQEKNKKEENQDESPNPKKV